MTEPSAPTVPADVVARVEGVELKNLVEKVQNGGTLTTAERQTFAKLTEKYGAAPANKAGLRSGEDSVPALQDEGERGAKSTRNQRLARVQVVAEWMCAYKTRIKICQLAAKRWGIAARTADELIAAAKRQLADPFQHSRQVFRSMQVRGLQTLVAARLEGNDTRDPLDAMKELSKLLGLNEPERTEVQQEISTPDGTPLVQFFIPDNGRKLNPDQPAESPPAGN
jgi:hypothetical protein